MARAMTSRRMMTKGVICCWDARPEKKVSAKTPKISSMMRMAMRMEISGLVESPFCSKILRKMTVEVIESRMPIAAAARGESPKKSAI